LAIILQGNSNAARMSP